MTGSWRSYGRRMTTHASLSALFPTAFARAGRVIFADAVRDHQDEVYGVALRILGDRDAAREAASAAFLKAYRSLDRYDQTRPVRYWLLRIAANEAISVGRSRTRARARAGSGRSTAGAVPRPRGASVLQRAIGRRDRGRDRTTGGDGRRPAPSRTCAPADDPGGPNMSERPNDLLDETTLRRALRLEADERAPLFDPAAIAAAGRVPPRMVLVSASAA